MTTFLHPKGKTYRYDFHWGKPGEKSKRYTGSTGQLTKVDADAVESEIKKHVRQEAFGIVPFDRMRTPSFSVFATVHLEFVAKRGKVLHLDQLENNLRHVLMFFGRRPANAKAPSTALTAAQREKIQQRAAAAPYHDLRLADPILDPEWIEKFEDWMLGLGLSGARKNHLRSAASGIYRTALRPAFRKKANVERNPFLNIDRDQGSSRDRTLSRDQLLAWITYAAPHIRVAMAIAAYTPKLREGVILQLRWKEHLNAALTRITVQRHKARRWKNRAQVAIIPADLRLILSTLRTARPSDDYVVNWRGEPVSSVATGLAAAADRANETLPADEQIIYGVKHGVTFHTIRHTMATMLAELEVSESLRGAVMDQEPQTIRGYTHLRPTHEQSSVDRLADHLQLVEAVKGPVQIDATPTSENIQRTPRRRASPVQKRHTN